MNKRVVYLERKSYVRFDENHCLVYLNEEVLDKYVPEDAPKGFKPCTAYAYSGPESDGGTLIDCKEVTRDELINGIIRSEYSQTAEDAIKTHQLLLIQEPMCAKAEEYQSEWAKFKVEREHAISVVDEWLGISK